MSWTATPVAPEEVTPERLYRLAKHHRLVRENQAEAIENFILMARDCAMIELLDGEDLVGTLLITDIVDGDQGTVDLIPIPKHFTPENEYGTKMRESVTPIFEKLMSGRGLRRLNAAVPKTRSKTQKALREAGFKKEGVRRLGIKLRGKEPEDVVMMGMLAPKESGHGISE